MRCSLQHYIFHSGNQWLAVWALEPDYLGLDPGPASDWLCDLGQVTNVCCHSIFICEIGIVMVPAS